MDELHRADQGDVGPLGEMFARAMLDSLMRFIIPALAGPVRLVPLEALASKDISAEALRKAAGRGRLRAHKSDFGTWQSTRQWVDDYLAERFASLRKPATAS
ncbi:MAG: hypothetical protein JO247_22800 [Chloroflexi bacterium]|nr:hypothetical protein [Chloroflexota bacterium]